MNLRHLYGLILCFCTLFFGLAAAAQTGSPSLVPLESGEEPSGWEAVAVSAEATLAGPPPSLFRLNRIREELVVWRDEFADGASINAGRIETVRAQIAALGQPPEAGDEPEAIATKRDGLERQLSELRAPALLAQEAYARANGLITEVDALIRGRDADALTTRGPTPLNPVYWPDAFGAVGSAVVRLGGETAAKTRADLNSGKLWRNLPMALLFLVIAVVLLVRSRKWVLGLQSRVDHGTARGRAVWSFLLSVWQIILPVLGLAALSIAVERLDVLGSGGGLLFEAIVAGALIIILARWLSSQLFPIGENSGPLRYAAAVRAKLRRTGILVAWLVAALQVVTALISIAEPEQISTAVVTLPFNILLGLTLFRFGRLIRTDPEATVALGPDEEPPRGRARRIVGLLCIVVAVATPILAALGFAAASGALFTPAVLTLAILGVVLLLQRFVGDLWDLRSGAEVPEKGPLAPVLIGFLLFVIALPVLALVWGARVEDLLEVWTRFREGFAIGETRISPTDFVTFAAVFAVGYLLTRFIQGTLRASVLPRTKLDLGGQNAVVAGFGYVGIILSAIIAITMAGIDLSNLAIVAGALSVGIGFGLQNIVSNFVSGIILLIERPIGEGDWIEVNGTMGYVRDISVRSTRVETFDRTDVIIPNADLVSGQVINWTRGNAVGRVIVPVGVAYGTDVQEVIGILREVARGHPMVLLNPEPSVLFLEFGDNSLNFEIRAILRDVNFVLGVKSEMNIEIEKRFAEAGIEIPFPQRDLWLKNPEALKGDPA